MKIEETVIDNIRSRPRFKIFTEISREEYSVYLKSFLKNNSDYYEGNINSEAATISVKSEHNHYWKPCLTLRTEIDPDENKTLIRGIFGPTSAVWTFFMFLNFVFSILWMIAFTLWYVEKQIKGTDFPWALPFSFVMVVCLLFTFLAARIGKYLARKEMLQLREFAEQSIRSYEQYYFTTKDSHQM